jgi:ABC-type transport system substrate-binding protein
MRINALSYLFITLLLIASCGRSTETVVIRSEPAAMATPAPDQIDEILETAPALRTQFRYGEWQKIPSLDPLFASNTASQRAVQLIYEGLVRFDEQGSITPAHARRWQTDNDSLAWTFTLNRNRFFHDDEAFITGQGRRVTAGDYKRSFERMASPDVPGHAAELFREVIFGFDAYYLEQRNLTPGKSPNYTQIEGIIAQNDSTLRIELNRKDPYFLQRLASPYAVVYPMEAVRHHTALHRNPVGSGPFSFRSATGDSLFVLNRFTAYQGSSAEGINRIEIHSIDNETRLYRRLATDRIDMIPELGPLLLQGLVNEDGDLQTSFRERYRLIPLGQKTLEIAYNPSNRFNVTFEQAGSVLQNLSFDSLTDSLNVPLLEFESTAGDFGSEGFQAVRQRFPESVSRRNVLLMNFPDYESGHIANAMALAMRSGINVMTVNTPNPGIDVLFITRRVGQDAGGKMDAQGSQTLAKINIPRYAVTLANVSGVRFNRFDWWMSISQLNRAAEQS